MENRFTRPYGICTRFVMTGGEKALLRSARCYSYDTPRQTASQNVTDWFPLISRSCVSLGQLPHCVIALKDRYSAHGSPRWYFSVLLFIFLAFNLISRQTTCGGVIAGMHEVFGYWIKASWQPENSKCTGMFMTLWLDMEMSVGKLMVTFSSHEADHLFTKATSESWSIIFFRKFCLPYRYTWNLKTESWCQIKESMKCKM